MKTHVGFKLFIGVLSIALVIMVTSAYANDLKDSINELIYNGNYLTGDKHNHTTCSDGSTSVKVLVDQSITRYGLDWFSQSGHGGSYPRDCRFSDPDYSNAIGDAVLNRQLGFGEGAFYVNTVGADAIKGDFVDTTFTVWDDPATPEHERVQSMWRWQSIQDFNYEELSSAGRQSGKPVWQGLEWIVPGHEHTSMSVLDGQFPGPGLVGNADPVAQFEYLWDRADNDFSGGKAEGFEDPANNGVPKQPNIAGDHQKSVEAIKWLVANFPTTSYAVHAHIERQGAYVSTEDRGYNIEHIRDWHNAGLLDPLNPEGESVAFGIESQPGHAFASEARGTYAARRPSACFWTYGGTGCYTAAEASLPGKDFDGKDLTDEDLEALRKKFNEESPLQTDLNVNAPKERYVLGRPGVRTMWDALLAEGRKYFFFASSDWHNRGQFGPFEPQSTLDAWPGEYQKIYVYTPNHREDKAQAILEGMRKGNSYSVMGDLISKLYFVACYKGDCATMGETLEVPKDGKGKIRFRVDLVDPEGVNYCPYTFLNPSLAQIQIPQRMDKPVLHHVDVIKGDITGIIKPTDPNYTTNNSNPTAHIFATFDKSNWKEKKNGLKRMTWKVNVKKLEKSFYVRLRGTNLPQGTPYETDENGNPLPDNLADNIPCPFEIAKSKQLSSAKFAEDEKEKRRSTALAACPDHLPFNEKLGVKVIDADVEAWADLWFYSNPIFVKLVD